MQSSAKPATIHELFRYIRKTRAAYFYQLNMRAHFCPCISLKNKFSTGCSWYTEAIGIGLHISLTCRMKNVQQGIVTNTGACDFLLYVVVLLLAFYNNNCRVAPRPSFVQFLAPFHTVCFCVLSVFSAALPHAVAW